MLDKRKRGHSRVNRAEQKGSCLYVSFWECKYLRGQRKGKVCINKVLLNCCSTYRERILDHLVVSWRLTFVFSFQSEWSTLFVSKLALGSFLGSSKQLCRGKICRFCRRKKNLHNFPFVILRKNKLSPWAPLVHFSALLTNKMKIINFCKNENYKKKLLANTSYIFGPLDLQK